MIVINSDSIKAIEVMDEIVKQGPIYSKSLLDANITGGFGASLGNFGPGARLNYHIHNSEQILYVVAGKGIVATQDRECIVTPGDIIYFEPGEIHWHGATQESSFSHLNIQKTGIRLAV